VHTFFIDRDPSLFSQVLHFVKNSTPGNKIMQGWWNHDRLKLKQLASEAEYYKLPALSQTIQDLLSRPPPRLRFTPDPSNIIDIDSSGTIATKSSRGWNESFVHGAALPMTDIVSFKVIILNLKSFYPFILVGVAPAAITIDRK